MADDIVTRLRNSCHTSAIRDLPCTIVAPQGCPPCEAADEIERLEKDRDQWRTLAESFSVCPDGCEDCKNEYEEMVNGKV